MVQKELDYVRSREAADGSSDEKGGVYIDAFDQSDKPPLKGWAKFRDSFRRFDDNDLGIDPNLSDVEKIAIRTANSPLSRSLKGRHMQMIAIGGSIGTGLFVGSGLSLESAGPGGLVLDYVLVSSMIWCTCQSLGELAVTFPVSGAFVTYNQRFVDPSWGFAMAWNYAIQWLVTLPVELVAAAMTVQYWNDKISPAAWVAIFYVVIVVINFFGVKGYGEAEFLFAIIKVTAVIGFMIFGIVVAAGGGPAKNYGGSYHKDFYSQLGTPTGYIGARLWHNPGSFSYGFHGVCSVFVNAAFAFAGTELVGLAAAESANPSKMLPRATKQVVWRICLFYVISLTIIGCLVSYKDPRLVSGTSSADAKASPFVISIKNAGVNGLPSVMNVVILIAVLSVGNSSVFASSRTFAALAASGQAPKIFGYIDKAGRPMVGIIIQCIFGLLCFLAASSKESEVFSWLMALSGLSSIFTWGSINLCHIRFRRALKVQGRDTSELTFSSQGGIWAAYYGLGFNILVLIAQFYVALFPVGGSPSALGFFNAYLSAVIVLAFYIAHKIWKRNWSFFIRAKDMDIDTGRRELDIELAKQEIAEEKERIRAKPFYYRIYYFWC